MHVAFLEPHLEPYGGIRRVLELGNGLVDLGHAVTYLVPDGKTQPCQWMRCAGELVPFSRGKKKHYDLVICNHEVQWADALEVTNADLRVFFALHYARTYDKPWSWECYRMPWDLYLANSSWTADSIEYETGIRPVVIPGGINPKHFHPLNLEKHYPVLTMGDERRPWKGHADVLEACSLAGTGSPEVYAGRGYPQEEMASVYGKAEIFVVGSWFEGFCQPGIEALACGVPLVTTDCGGNRDYAIDGETALVVPAREPAKMAKAIHELRGNSELRARLSANGLELVSRDFSWARAAKRLESVLMGAIDRKKEWSYAPPATIPTTTPNGKKRLAAVSERFVPKQELPAIDRLSVVTLSLENPELTTALVASLRKHSTCPIEVIVIDNGSSKETREAIRGLGDIEIFNKKNLGFAAGMNQGLKAANYEAVVFINNDTRVPQDWDGPLRECMRDPSVGIVAPAVTNAGGWVSVRDKPSDQTLLIKPFSEPPPAVCYAIRRETIEKLGGWAEDYEIASGEDLDLCFKNWVEGYHLVLEERVLIEHIGKATSAQTFSDWQGLWKKNRQHFFKKWIIPPTDLAPMEVKPTGQAKASASAAAWESLDATAAAVERMAERLRTERSQFASVLLQQRRESEALRKKANALQTQADKAAKLRVAEVETLGQAREALTSHLVNATKLSRATVTMLIKHTVKGGPAEAPLRAAKKFLGW